MKIHRLFFLAAFVLLLPGIGNAAPFLETQVMIEFHSDSIFGGFFWTGNSDLLVSNDLEGAKSLSIPSSNPASIRTDSGSAVFIPGQEPNLLGATVRASIPIRVDLGSEWHSVASTSTTFFMAFAPGTASIAFDFEESLVADFDYPDNHTYAVRNFAYIDVFSEYPFDGATTLNSDRMVVFTENRSQSPSSFQRTGTKEISLAAIVGPDEPLFVRMSMETWLEAVDISESPIHAPVPEPGTLILLASGGIGLIFLRKRR
jgi:hypothetical protein